MFNVPDVAITSLDEILAYSLAGMPLFTLDELQNATIANTEEKVDITGRGGRKLSSLKRNKAVVISGTNGLVSGGLMEVQVGSSFESRESTPVAWQEIVTVQGGVAHTEFKAVGTAGAEIVGMQIRDTNGAAGEFLQQDADVAAGKFTYDPATRELKFFEDIVDGTSMIVSYTRNIEGAVLTNLSDHYSGKVRLYINATGEDRCGNLVHVQFYIPKADFNGNFDIELGGDQTVHAFEAESLAGSCGDGGALWTYTVFGANAADAA